MTRVPALLLLAAASLPAGSAGAAGAAAGAAGPAAGAAEFRGALTCGVLPGYTRRPLPSTLVIQAENGRLSYRHPVLDWQDIRMPDDHQELGAGTVAGEQVHLVGRAAGNGSWSYTARYDGTLRDGLMRLDGAQSWTGTGLAPATVRACHAELRRVGG